MNSDISHSQHAPANQSSSGWRTCWTLLEAGGWTVGYLLAQALVLTVLLAVLLIASYGFTWPARDDVLRWCLDQNLDRSFLLVGSTSLGTLLVMIPLVMWREGRAFRQRLGWRTPNEMELVYSLATVAPIAVLGNVVYDMASDWRSLIAWPFAAALRESSIEELYSRFHGVPFPVLVVAMALGPAIGEELVFRGVLGRRLIERFGTAWGVGLTSVCFAAAHLDPWHALATLPIAVLLHLLYLRTGTIWVPVLVHFGNNLLALSLVRFAIPTVETVSPLATAGICAYLGVILFLLHTRTRTPAGAPGWAA